MSSTKKKSNQAAAYEAYNNRLGRLVLRRHSYHEEELQRNQQDKIEYWYRFPSISNQACFLKTKKCERPVNCMQLSVSR
ncbi:MAG: hypothetical protein D3923_18455 [Candidatus Electrothrix sp. AR3]|nr:hypothetical protein [Candidatus Electrothrix sp. AR3]